MKYNVINKIYLSQNDLPSYDSYLIRDWYVSISIIWYYSNDFTKLIDLTWVVSRVKELGTNSFIQNMYSYSIYGMNTFSANEETRNKGRHNHNTFYKDWTLDSDHNSDIDIYKDTTMIHRWI